jgi:maltodextrin utilization protein YvdJ
MEAQVLIEIAAEYAKQERYQLQHTKTNSIRIHSNRKQYSTGQHNLNSLQINGQPINDTKEAHHIGLLQSDTIAKTMEINVEQNIKKARRTT